MAVKKPLVVYGGTVKELQDGDTIPTDSVSSELLPECVFSANFGASNGWDLPNRVGSGFTYFNEAVTVNPDGSITLDGDSMYATCKYIRFPIHKATYHFKFKTSETAGYCKIFSYGGTNDSNTPQSNRFDCAVDSDGTLYFFTETGGGANHEFTYNTGYVLNNGSLYDLIFTLNGNKINIWVNGEHTNIDESFTQPEGAIWEYLEFFRQLGSSGAFFQGYFYEFDIFNGVLNESQIDNLYQNGYNPSALVISQASRLSLGEFASDPTTDNEGNALLIGATYYNTTDNVLKIYDGSQWVAKVDPDHNHDTRYYTKSEIEDHYYPKKYIDLLVRFSSDNPTERENPETQEVLFVNVRSGEVFVCTSNARDRNTWKGQLGTNVP